MSATASFHGFFTNIPRKHHKDDRISAHLPQFRKNIKKTMSAPSISNFENWGLHSSIYGGIMSTATGLEEKSMVSTFNAKFYFSYYYFFTRKK